MTNSRWDEFLSEKQRIYRQTEAEFAFAESLALQGVSGTDFRKQWKLSLHQFNLLAHYVYGVNDVEPDFPPMLKALIFTMQQAKRAA